MVRGLYTGASGMVAQMHKMDALANNIANVDVNGYKKDVAVHKAFPQLLIRRLNDDGQYIWPFGSSETAPVVGTLGTGVEMNEAFTVFSQGSLKETGNPFDVALDGEGFFTIQTPQGLRYTRNGSFILGKEGLLLTKEGYPVLGQNGPVRIKKNNFVIDKQGRVFENDRYADGPDRLVSMEENAWEETELVDTLDIVTFRRTRFLEKQGSSLWRSTVEAGGEQSVSLGQDTKVFQGFLESANVNPVREMVDMIEVNRAYEANQKVIQSQDALTQKLLNEAARA